jgi:hypothetical protein
MLDDLPLSGGGKAKTWRWWSVVDANQDARFRTAIPYSSTTRQGWRWTLVPGSTSRVSTAVDRPYAVAFATASA